MIASPNCILSTLFLSTFANTFRFLEFACTALRTALSSNATGCLHVSILSDVSSEITCSPWSSRARLIGY